MNAGLLSAFSARGPAASSVSHGLNRGNVEERHVGPTLAVGEDEEYLGLEQHRGLGADHFVRLPSGHDQAKPYERVTVQKLTNVIADHAYVVSLGDRRRQPDDPTYAPASAASLALVIRVLARV